MSAVDVLAAMQEAIDFIACRVSGNSSMLADISEARAAVAELIDADREFDAAMHSEADTDGNLRREDARERRATALANIGAAT